MGKLDGKVAVITGGASGMGAAAAKLFASEGAKIVIGDRNVDSGNAKVKGIRDAGGESIFVETNLRKEADCKNLIDQAVKAFGSVDVVFNSAAIDIGKFCLEYDSNDFDAIMSTNVFGTFFVNKYAALNMIERGKPGVIVNTGSTCSFQTNENNALYTTSKGAILAMTKALALDLAKHQIRVNALCPGHTETEMLIAFFNEFEDPQAMRQKLSEGVPLGRIAKPEDQAKAALFLACDDSSYMTGSSLLVDGGLLTFFK